MFIQHTKNPPNVFVVVFFLAEIYGYFFGSRGNRR